VLRCSPPPYGLDGFGRLLLKDPGPPLPPPSPEGFDGRGRGGNGVVDATTAEGPRACVVRRSAEVAEAEVGAMQVEPRFEVRSAGAANAACASCAGIVGRREERWLSHRQHTGKAA
jgi:hypothetical protein